MRVDAQFLAVHILTNGHVFHLGSYDASLGISHLCDGLAFLGSAWFLDMLKPQRVQAMVGEALSAILATYLLQDLGISTLLYPFLSQAWQSLLQVNGDIRVAERSACVIYVYWGIGLAVHFPLGITCHRGCEVHLSHAHPDIGEQSSLHVCLLALGISLMVVWSHILVCGFVL